MSERKADKQAPAPWQVPVAIEDVAETGRHFDLVADNDVRAAVARWWVCATCRGSKPIST